MSERVVDKWMKEKTSNLVGNSAKDFIEDPKPSPNYQRAVEITTYIVMNALRRKNGNKLTIQKETKSKNILYRLKKYLHHPK